MILREHGPAKSGNTTRLIQAANAARRDHNVVRFHTVEHIGEVLRERGLHPDIEVVLHPWIPYKPMTELEWVEVLP